jgi:4a-hydroxytetrahydrobiopterin dehydratase
LPTKKVITPTLVSGYATVSLSTKKIKGLPENDFIMASKIDRVLDRSGRPIDRQQ